MLFAGTQKAHLTWELTHRIRLNKTMKEKPQSADSTRPDWMCQNPHGLHCLVHKRVLSGDLKPCSVCEDSVDKMREMLSENHTRILQTETVAAPSGSQPDSVACSDWMDALAEIFERNSAHCAQSATKNGELNGAFTVVGHVLAALAIDLRRQSERASIGGSERFQEAGKTQPEKIE